MRKIIKILAFLSSLILVFSSFFLAGTGQETYFYAACGFALAGILVFIMFMREKKQDKKDPEEQSTAAPVNTTEEK